MRQSALDFTVSLIARGAGAPLALAANVLLARALGAERYGQYLTLVSAALVAGGISGFGVSGVITREIAAQPLPTRHALAREIVRWANMLTAQYGALAATLLVLWLALGPGAPISNWPQRLLAAGLVLPSIWVVTFPSGLAGLMRVPQSEAIANTIKNSILLGAAWFITTLPTATADYALVAQLSSTTLAAMIGYAWFRHYAQPPTEGPVPVVTPTRPDPDRKVWWRSSAYFFSISVATIVLMRLDVVIVNAFANETEAGLFGAAARLAQAAQVVGLVWLVWLRPRIASAVARSARHEVVHLLRTSTLGIVSMAGAITCIAWLVAPLIITLFGRGFDGAVWPFRLLLLANFTWCAVVPLYTLLTMAGAERTTSRIIWAQLVLTLGLSVPLCRLFGATGAAYAWATGSVAWAIAIAVVGVRNRVLSTDRGSSAA